MSYTELHYNIPKENGEKKKLKVKTWMKICSTFSSFEGVTLARPCSRTSTVELELQTEARGIILKVE